MLDWPHAQAALRSKDWVTRRACHRLVSRVRQQVADNRPVFHPSRESRRLARRSKLRVGPTLAIGVLTLMLCLGIGLLYIGWHPDSSLSLTGFIAMTLGLLAAIILGIGLALLVHRNRRDD